MSIPRRTAALVAAVASTAACAGTAHAQAGAPSSFAQLTGEASCVAQISVPKHFEGLAGCTKARALVQAEAVAVSPDDRHVYVAASGYRGGGSNAVVAFARDGSGRLAPIGCVSDDGGDGNLGSDGACAEGDALLGANDVAVSPDGRSVYVTTSSSHGLTWFARDAETGKLTQRGCFKEFVRSDRCAATTGLLGATSVSVSPDGLHVYVASDRSDAVVAFSREAETGDLTAVQCTSANGSDGLCADGTALNGASEVAVSPDGKVVYVAAEGTGALDVFARDAETGKLTQIACVIPYKVPGDRCSEALGLFGAGTLVVSPDGRDVLVGGQFASTIGIFHRTDDGGLRPGGCLVNSEPQGDDRVFRDEDSDDDEDEELDEGDRDEDAEFASDERARAAQAERTCTPAKALGSVRELALSPDGRSLIAAGYGTLAAFERDPSTGTLRQTGCAEAYRTYVSCVEGKGLYGTSGVAISADAKSMYVASRVSHAVAVFGAAATVTTRAASVSRAGIARVRVACPRARTAGCSGRVIVRGGARRKARASGSLYRLAAGRAATYAVRVPRGAGRRVTVLASDARRLTRASMSRIRLRR